MNRSYLHPQERKEKLKNGKMKARVLEWNLIIKGWQRERSISESTSGMMSAKPTAEGGGVTLRDLK